MTPPARPRLLIPISAQVAGSGTAAAPTMKSLALGQKSSLPCTAVTVSVEKGENEVNPRKEVGSVKVMDCIGFPSTETWIVPAAARPTESVVKKKPPTAEMLVEVNVNTIESVFEDGDNQMSTLSGVLLTNKFEVGGVAVYVYGVLEKLNIGVGSRLKLSKVSL